MSKLENVVSDVVYLEIRNGYPSESFKSIYASLGWKYLPWLNFIVDTKDRGVMIKRISESRRRQLRKAEKLGVTILNPDRESDVKEFYAILLGLYKTKIKKPLPEYELFRNFFLMDTRNYVLVYFEQKVIGGILCPFLEGVGNYEFYIAGLDQAYKDCYPSAMATFGAMKQANEMNLPTFDFMGGGSPSEGYGVREFKSRFGGEEVEWGRWLKVRKKLIYYLGSSYIKWKAK
jgi:lipid II:glycine glycyltransferase (peptidoglycan interpeptide bridge formation enzyme)